MGLPGLRSCLAEVITLRGVDAWATVDGHPARLRGRCSVLAGFGEQLGREFDRVERDRSQCPLIPAGSPGTHEREAETPFLQPGRLVDDDRWGDVGTLAQLEDDPVRLEPRVRDLTAEFRRAQAAMTASSPKEKIGW